ncbi:MAG: SPOR domain-containing protein [Neisseriaceae bacterium]|nr:SPOR domain-containing protein [Neisseriaceae bacterium]
MKRQQGQTLGGMILGILIAVVILGGAFWFFSQQKAPFQPDVVTKEALPVPEPEIIVPNDGLDSILHKNPEDWITEGTDAQPEPSAPVDKPVTDELGAFIEKDLAPKDNLVIDTKPVVVAPAAADKPAAQAKPEQPKAEKPKVEKKAEPAKKAEPSAKPADTAKAAAKSGTLQAGAYRTPEQAEEQKVKLALMGYTANVIKADLGEKGIMYRVRLSVPDTQVAKTDLAGKGVDVMTIR